MKRIRGVLLKALLALLILAVVAAAAGAYLFRQYLPQAVAPRSFPEIDGVFQVPTLDAPVDVYRDAHGVAHIYASSVHDVFLAQGYIHAQERFWQMDTWRHIGSGRLAEMFGEGTVETDAFLRTLGWHQTAEAELDQLSPHGRLLLESYAEGVNAYIENRAPVELSLEYAVLGLLSPDYEIEPWQPLHSLTWGKAMAWDLRANMDEEIERAILLKTLDEAQVDELFPPYPDDHPVIVGEFAAEGQTHHAEPSGSAAAPVSLFENVNRRIELLHGLLGPGTRGIGSNSWVISGDLSATGMPLFANDPHLSSQMPSIWYQVGLHCRPKTDECPYSAVGFSFAGVPGIVIGHNDRIVWGMSNVGPDVMDLFIEKVNPNDPNQYEVDGQWVDFERRTETIAVAGAEPRDMEVRISRHGPVISDSYGEVKDVGEPGDTEFVPFRERAGVDLPGSYAIALAWTALEPSTPFDAIWALDRAQNWDEFREAARRFRVPAQNLLYADVDGNIGYQMPGMIPVRAAGDGRFPVPGWTREYDWVAYLDFDDLPFAFNPPDGFIVTANNRVPPRDYPYLITTDWDYGFRAQRLTNLIRDAGGPIDMAYMQKMHADTLDPMASVLVPLLSEALPESHPQRTGAQAALLTSLETWDYRAEADSQPAAIFEAFWNHLLLNTFQDDLPEEYWPEGSGRWMEIVRRISREPDSRWWDDQRTEDRIEKRDEILTRSFAAAVEELTRLLGSDTGEWSWGRLHTVTFRNGTLGESGIGAVESLFNRGPFPTGGGDSIVNATGWTVGEGYSVDWLPSMRMIVDMGDLNNSVTMHTTGQSGHAFHTRYDDLAAEWAAVRYYPMLWDEAVISAGAEGHLLLRP